MSTKNNEELIKSIDALLDEVFTEEVVETEEVNKSIDIAKDSDTTADEAVAQAPSLQKDESRGAGRPKQISDVPQTDADGKRESEYDASITSNEGKEDEPEEAKKQVKAIDQVSKEGHVKKSLEISEEELKDFEEFKKSKVEALQKAQQAEELKKAEIAKKEQEELVKSAVAQATAQLAKENEELRKSFAETNALIKAMASQPRGPKSITGIEALEKSVAPEDKGPETFTKSEILDCAFELAKAGKIPHEAVSELEFTNRVADPEVRALIEKHLQGK